MHEDSDRDERQETRSANVNGSMPFMLSALTSSGMVCPSSDSGAGMPGPSDGNAKAYASPNSLNELIGECNEPLQKVMARDRAISDAVGTMVDDYASRNECETDSLHALVASVCCTNKAKLDILRDSTPWDAYRALNFHGKKARRKSAIPVTHSC
jgi:hypothetical protein